MRNLCQYISRKYLYNKYDTADKDDDVIVFTTNYVPQYGYTLDRWYGGLFYFQGNTTNHTIRITQNLCLNRKILYFFRYNMATMFQFKAYCTTYPFKFKKIYGEITKEVTECLIKIYEPALQNLNSIC